MNRIYKKMALLVLIGAMLAGCSKKVENPKPSVSILEASGFTTGNNHLFTGSTLKFGFDANYNELTGKKLTKFRAFVSDGKTILWDTIINLNNETNFHYEGDFTFIELGDWQIVGRAYDAADEEGSAYINIHVQEDMEENFVWQKIGQDSVTGFGNYGLKWVDSVTADSVSVALDTIYLLPADSLVSLYLFDQSKWNEIDTYEGKDAFFKNIKKNPRDYKDNKIESYNIFALEEVVTYNAVLAVMNENEDEENYMLLIKDSYSENYSENANGIRHLTVNGKSK